MTAAVWWYAARSSGYVAWALLAASVIWGLMLSGKIRPGNVRPNWILDLHRYLGGLAVVFTGIHVLTIMADTYTDFGPTDVLVPLVSDWNPWAVAWGIASMYLLLAVEVTSLLRKRMSKKWWRATHLLSFPLYLTASVHLFTAGTDASNLVSAAVVVAATVAILGLTAWRVIQHTHPFRARPAL